MSIGTIIPFLRLCAMTWVFIGLLMSGWMIRRQGSAFDYWTFIICLAILALNVWVRL